MANPYKEDVDENEIEGLERKKHHYWDALEKKLAEIDKRLQKECLQCHGNNWDNHIVELPEVLNDEEV